VAPEIVDAARRWGADLLMMPTHGRGTFRRLLLGSVTAKVLHDLECPVWTDVHSETAPPIEEIHCRRILCAVDLSEQAQPKRSPLGRLTGRSVCGRSGNRPRNS
jgi:hypothetical protein